MISGVVALWQYCEHSYPPSVEMIEHKLSLCPSDWMPEQRQIWLSGLVEFHDWQL